jgi:DNA-binding NarL/FixJ family response regulator
VKAVRNAISSRSPRIVVADDSTVAREGTAAIIRDLPCVLCGLATDQQTTSKLLEQHHPDLLLIEPFFGNRDGIFFLKELAGRFPETRILVVSKQQEEICCAPAPQATG